MYKGQRAPHLIDGYKADHRRQYPDGTNLVLSNFTPRTDRLAKVLRQYWDGKVVVFGLQAFIIAFFQDFWNQTFFWCPKAEVIAEYKRRLDNYLGKDAVPVEHMEALHDLGYLPLEIRALPEGTLCPVGVPVFTIVNTHPDFFWLVNYSETILSNGLWKYMTSATIALQYRRILEHWCNTTGGTKEFIPWQAHDFSFRGMSGLEDAVASGSGHLLSFTGTDTIPAIDHLEYYYFANSDKELVGGSVPATEHSVMCMGGKETERETFLRLLKLYPKGPLSVVSDTWNYWKVVTEVVPSIKDVILAREGKLVIRPDSGDPVRIVAGYLEHEVVRSTVTGGWIRTEDGAYLTDAEVKGTVQCLWETFGGTFTSNGYMTLDSHIGLIYGDSITLERADKILYILAAKGFSSDNVVFGVGSYTYEHVTRDTFGFAMKATYGEINGVPQDIYKDPATDRNASKKSARGKLAVLLDERGDLTLVQQATPEQEQLSRLKTIFKNGNMIRLTTLADIRKRVLG